VEVGNVHFVFQTQAQCQLLSFSKVRGFCDPKLSSHYIMSSVTGHCEEEPKYAGPLPFSSLDIKARNALCSNNIIIIQKNSTENPLSKSPKKIH